MWQTGARAHTFCAARCSFRGKATWRLQKDPRISPSIISIGNSLNQHCSSFQYLQITGFYSVDMSVMLTWKITLETQQAFRYDGRALGWDELFLYARWAAWPVHVFLRFLSIYNYFSKMKLRLWESLTRVDNENAALALRVIELLWYERRASFGRLADNWLERRFSAIRRTVRWARPSRKRPAHALEVVLQYRLLL